MCEKYVTLKRLGTRKLGIYSTTLRHYTTSQEVAGTIPDEVNAFFSHTMAVGLTRPRPEMNTRKLPGVKDDQLTILLPSLSQLPRKYGCLSVSQPLWASTACYRDSVTFTRSVCILFGKSNDKKSLCIYIF
jgi:hypothetical protein